MSTYPIPNIRTCSLGISIPNDFVGTIVGVDEGYSFLVTDLDWSYVGVTGGEVALNFSLFNVYDEESIFWWQRVSNPVPADNPLSWRGKCMVRASTPMTVSLSGDCDAISLLISGYLLLGDTPFPGTT